MDMEDLRRIRTRIEQLSSRHEAMLQRFWVEAKSTFGQYGPSDMQDHVTTACTCVLSFLDFPGGKLPPFLGKKKADFLKWLLSVPWKSEGLPENNPYTAPLALAALLKLADRSVLDESRPRAAVHTLLAGLQDSKLGAIRMPGYPPNGFLTYWTVRALGDAVVHYRKGWWSAARDEVNATEEGIALAGRWAEDEAYRHIAYYYASDLDRYDALQLGYVLSIVDLVRASRGSDPDRVLITKGLEVLFASQLANGLWPKAVPLFHYPDAGSVYPFAFETLTAVMRLGSRERDEHAILPIEFFEPHIGSLLRTLGWAESHELADDRLRGWRSNNVLPGSQPQAWATAMVLSFVRGLHVLFQRIVQERLLDEFGAVRYPQRTSTTLTATSWSQLADAETEIAAGRKTTIKALLFDYLLVSHAANATTDPIARKKRWSAILYGPPGTAKTTFAEEIAKSLGWPLVIIETSDFLAQGIDKMAHQAQLLFRKLEQLRQVVVFIDEVEEFVRAREDRDRQSRLTTTAMLTLLQRFRRNRSAILLLATNHVEVFDRAITRPGRFDLMVVVKPPSVDSKIALWREKRQSSSADEVNSEEAVLRSSADLIERFTFDEWTSFMERYEELWGKTASGTDKITQLLREAADGLTIDEAEWKRWANLKSVVR